MHGDLATTHVAEVLLDLHTSARTGILRLSQGELKKGIYFKDGAIVFAHSNVKSERLGETLLRLGKITDEEFRIASIEVIEHGKRLGRTLFEKGYLSDAEVNAGVNYQLQQIVYSVFNWVKGEYEFVDRERPVYEDIMVDISTPDLLIEGVRHITNPAVIEKIIGTDESVMVDRLDEASHLPRVNLDFAEETILGCLGENASIARLRSLSHFSPVEFGKAIYALMLAGMIQLRPAEPDERSAGSSKAAKQEKSSFMTQPMSFIHRKKTAESPPPRVQLKTVSESDMRRMIVETEASFREMTDEEVLGVLPDCTREEIQKAYDKQISIFHPPLYSEERYRDLKEQLKFISERLAAAYDHLLDQVASRVPLTSHTLSASDSQAAMPLPEGIIVAQPMQEIDPISRPAPMITPAPAITATPSEKPPEVTELQEKLHLDPSNTSLLRLLAKAFVKEGKPQEGEKSLLRALELEPQSIENHFALADLYQTLGLRLKAFKHLNIVLQLDPENKRAMELLDVKKRKPLYEITREE